MPSKHRYVPVAVVKEKSLWLKSGWMLCEPIGQLMKSGDEWYGGGSHWSDTEMTADNHRERNYFWCLMQQDDWFTEAVAKSEWLKREVWMYSISWLRGKSKDAWRYSSLTFLTFALMIMSTFIQNIQKKYYTVCLVCGSDIAWNFRIHAR